MKKIFQIIGLISLTCFSFFLTERTALVVSDMDEIMIQIKNEKDKFSTEPIDSIIEDNTIIPGVNGRKVNINKSYKNMKINGFYHENLYVYDYTKPKVSLTDNKDKYIIKGNPSKRVVSLIFKVNMNDDIDSILDIINNYNIKSTFFVEELWFENNKEKINEMIRDGHNIGILTNDYTTSNFELINITLKDMNHKNNYCYQEEENKTNIDICKIKGNYTIMPTLISSTTPLSDIKDKLESGSLLSLKINSQVKKELSTIIIYIKSKGYKITNLDENILE